MLYAFRDFVESWVSTGWYTFGARAARTKATTKQQQRMGFDVLMEGAEIRPSVEHVREAQWKI